MADSSKIVVDLNKITRREFRAYLDKAKAEDTIPDDVQASFIEQVVTAWPYAAAVSGEAWLDLPLTAAVAVEIAIETAISDMRKKS